MDIYFIPKPSSQNGSEVVQFQKNEIPCGAGTV